jgi:hypothetical protein
MSPNNTLWDLRAIGLPVAYQTVNPWSLSAVDRVDAFPTTGNIHSVNIWSSLAGGSVDIAADIAWQQFLRLFTTLCRSKGLQPFVLAANRKPNNKRVGAYLTMNRRRVRDYLDHLPLLTLPCIDVYRYYEFGTNSWTLTSAVKFPQKIDSLGIARKLVEEQGWITLVGPTRFVGARSWYKWLRPGILRTGFSTSRLDSWLWYEIRCPLVPMLDNDGLSRPTNKQLTDTIDDIWLPIVKTIRWWSTSNLRILDL